MLIVLGWFLEVQCEWCLFPIYCWKISLSCQKEPGWIKDQILAEYVGIDLLRRPEKPLIRSTQCQGSPTEVLRLYLGRWDTELGVPFFCLCLSLLFPGHKFLSHFVPQWRHLWNDGKETSRSLPKVWGRSWFWPANGANRQILMEKQDLKDLEKNIWLKIW